MVVTKELLKSEIEKVQDQYLVVLYRIIKAPRALGIPYEKR